MIKGCQRRIIVIKDTGSRYFDTAYFVLKRDLPEAGGESDMLAEANRMLDDCSVVRHLEAGHSKADRRNGVIILLMGAAVLLLGGIMLLIGMCL